jgi:hypothetical protein
MCGAALPPTELCPVSAMPVMDGRGIGPSLPDHRITHAIFMTVPQLGMPCRPWGGPVLMRRWSVQVAVKGANFTVGWVAEIS